MVYNVCMRKDILKRESEIRQWINQNLSKAEICRRLYCKPDTLRLHLSKMRIVYQGNQGNKGRKIDPKYMTAVEYATTANPKSHTLKLKLLRDGIKQHKCERCLLSTWLEGNIPLELHHVDGDRFNNQLENLKLLCPNCHALEPNNSGAAIKKRMAT